MKVKCPSNKINLWFRCLLFASSCLCHFCSLAISSASSILFFSLPLLTFSSFCLSCSTESLWAGVAPFYLFVPVLLFVWLSSQSRRWGRLVGPLGGMPLFRFDPCFCDLHDFLHCLLQLLCCLSFRTTFLHVYTMAILAHSYMQLVEPSNMVILWFWFFQSNARWVFSLLLISVVFCFFFVVLSPVCSSEWWSCYLEAVYWALHKRKSKKGSIILQST